jgi:hypothetical protein
VVSAARDQIPADEDNVGQSVDRRDPPFKYQVTTAPALLAVSRVRPLCRKKRDERQGAECPISRVLYGKWGF